MSGLFSGDSFQSHREEPSSGSDSEVGRVFHSRENSDNSSDEGVSRLLSSDLSRLTIDEEPDRQDNPYRLFEDPFAGSDLSSAPQQTEPPSPIARQLAVPPSWTLQEVTTGPPSQNTCSSGRTASRPTTQTAAGVLPLHPGRDQQRTRIRHLRQGIARRGPSHLRVYRQRAACHRLRTLAHRGSVRKDSTATHSSRAKLDHTVHRGGA